MNSLPHSLDQSHGYFRRLIIVPFNKRISEKDANKNLINELLDELPGIFNFAIEGLARLRANNYIFSKSEAAENALNEYRAELDPLFEFINQKIESAEPNVRTRRKEIKNAYAEFLVHEGYKKVKELSDRRFWKLFREELNRRKINFEEEKINGERCFSGIQFFMERQELTLGEADLDVKTELDDYLDDDSDDYLDDDSDDYLDDDSEEYVVEDSDDEI